MRSTSGLVTFFEAENSSLAVVEGLVSPNPPSRHGRASKSLSLSFGAGRLDNVGINSVRICPQGVVGEDQCSR